MKGAAYPETRPLPYPSPSRGGSLLAVLAFPFLLAACHKAAPENPFPLPRRPVSPIVSPRYSNEDARDSVKEAQTVMALADLKPGMYAADIGAGEGYYTVRLAPLVGKKGRVL